MSALSTAAYILSMMPPEFRRAFEIAAGPKPERELKEEDVVEILQLREAGTSTAKIAKRMNLNQVTVARVIRLAKEKKKRDKKAASSKSGE